MEFRILGPLEVVEEGESLQLGGARQRGLLALLLTRPNGVVSTDRLVDQFWGARPPKTALNTIQYYVSQLRKSLGADRIVTRTPGYLIRVEPGELDLARFEALLKRDDVEALRDALALWRGPALADLAFEPLRRWRAAAWRSCASPLSSGGSISTWKTVAPPSSSASLKRWSPSTHFASGRVDSSCWRSTAAAGRPPR